MIGLVREAGGIGDIICTGAVARAIKREQPDEEVVSFVPEQFVSVAAHLKGVDKVESLGPLSVIRRKRRYRDSPLDPVKYPYLEPLLQYPEARFVDLYCPGYLNESSCVGRARLNRCQLFAMAAGVRFVSDARAEWVVREDERAAVRAWLTVGGLMDRNLIAVQPRATCSARSLPASLREELLKWLAGLGEVLVFDCVLVKVPDSRHVHLCTGVSVPMVAALMERCHFIVSVDSFSIHLAAALGKPAVGIFGPTDGQVTMQTYPGHVPIDGSGERCELPCSYSPAKNWSRTCRKTGCERMLSHSTDKIYKVLGNLLVCPASARYNMIVR